MPCDQCSFLPELFVLVSRHIIISLIIYSKQIHSKWQGFRLPLPTEQKHCPAAPSNVSPLPFFSLPPLRKVTSNLGIWSTFSDMWPTGTWHGILCLLSEVCSLLTTHTFQCPVCPRPPSSSLLLAPPSAGLPGSVPRETSPDPWLLFFYLFATLRFRTQAGLGDAGL
jgi:hypothetical protein